METIDTLVKKAIDDYPRFVWEKSQFEYHLSQRENPDMRDALTALCVKISTIESWFTLLDASERFVLRQMLIDQQQLAAAQRAAGTTWLWQASKNEKTPWQLRAQVLEKIVRFSERHEATMQSIFS